MSTTVTYKGSTLTTAVNQTRKLKTSGKYMEDDVTLVDVTAALNPQEKSVAITSAGTEVVTPDVGYDALSKVTITTPSTSCEMDVAYGYSYVDDVGVKFYATPRGYYSTSGWINSGYDYGDTTYWDTLSSGTTVTPTESSQTVGGSDVMMRDAITINAIPSNYVGTNVPHNDDNSLSIFVDSEEVAVIASSGYYQSNAEKIIPFASASQSITYEQSTGVITATGTFSSSGYVVSGSSFSASSQIALGHATLTSNGTYYAIDDDNDAWTGVTVSVNTPTPSVQSKSATPTESAQTILPDAGYYLSQVTVDAISPTYIGSSIPRRSSVVYFEEDGVTVEDGYYSSAFFTQIPKGSLYGGDQFYVSPSFSVNDNGVVQVQGSSTTAWSPVYSEGWLDTSASMSIYAYTIGSYQLTVGNSIGYGITDGTLPLVGVAKVGQAEI